jgi:mono/diheme cytochrome c family protein
MPSCAPRAAAAREMRWRFAVLLLALAQAHAAERSPFVNYVLRCSGCHGADGSGHESAGVPDFRDAVGAFVADEEGRTYLLHVPGIVNSSLTDAEIAAVLNYVMDQWAGTSLRPEFVHFTPQEAAERRARPVSDVVLLRRRVVARLSGQGIHTAAYPWP